MEFNIFPIGSLVYVTSYGPYRGFRGIIRAIDGQAPLYFYLVALHEGITKEPLWLVHDDIEEIEGENVSLWRPSRNKLSRVEIEALEIVSKVSGQEQDRCRQEDEASHATMAEYEVYRPTLL